MNMIYDGCVSVWLGITLCLLSHAHFCTIQLHLRRIKALFLSLNPSSMRSITSLLFTFSAIRRSNESNYKGFHWLCLIKCIYSAGGWSQTSCLWCCFRLQVINTLKKDILGSMSVLFFGFREICYTLLLTRTVKQEVGDKQRQNAVETLTLINNDKKKS